MLSPDLLKPQTPVDVREELGTSLPRTAKESRARIQPRASSHWQRCGTLVNIWALGGVTQRTAAVSNQSTQGCRKSHQDYCGISNKEKGDKLEAWKII